MTRMFKIDDRVVIDCEDDIYDNLTGTVIDIKEPKFSAMSTRYRVKFDIPVEIDGKTYETDQFLEHELKLYDTLSIKFSPAAVPSEDSI